MSKHPKPVQIYWLTAVVLTSFALGVTALAFQGSIGPPKQRPKYVYDQLAVVIKGPMPD